MFTRIQILIRIQSVVIISFTQYFLRYDSHLLENLQSKREKNLNLDEEVRASPLPDTRYLPSSSSSSSLGSLLMADTRVIPDFARNNRTVDSLITTQFAREGRDWLVHAHPSVRAAVSSNASRVADSLISHIAAGRPTAVPLRYSAV